MQAKLTLKTEGDTHVIVTRRFAAPAGGAVSRSHRACADWQWLLGAPMVGRMPVCISDARAGSKFRCEWVNGKGRGCYVTGE